MTDEVKGDEIRLVEEFLETAFNSIFSSSLYTVLDYHVRRIAGTSLAKLILEKPREVFRALTMIMNEDKYAVGLLERTLEKHIEQVLKRPVGGELFEAIVNDDAERVKQILIRLAREYMAKVRSV